MNGSLFCRAASKADLPEILRLYAQPDLDDGKMLPLFEAERIFDRMISWLRLSQDTEVEVDVSPTSS